MSETQQIPEEAKEAIKQLASSQNADPDELREEYTGYLEEENEKGVSNPGKRALRRLSLAHKGGQSQDAEQLRGYVLGASDPINTSQSAINRAKEYIEKQGAERAAQQGLVKKVPSGNLPDELAGLTVTQTEDGEKKEEVYAVLDSNSNSPTAGEVLPAEDYIRYAHGAVWRSADDGPHWFSGVLDADDTGVEPDAPPMAEPVSFEAVWVGESDQNNTIRLRFRDQQPFETIGQFGGPGPVELLEDDGLLGHVQLDEANADGFGRNDIFATYGSVTYMELAPDEGQSRRLSVVDPFAFDSDLQRTVWLPDHVEVDFATESDIYVIGQASPSNNEYADSVEALGVVVHPDYKVDRDGIESMAGDDADPPADGAGEPYAGEDDPADEAAADDGAKSPEELGREMEDPGEHETDDAEEEEYPPVVEDANYPELQSVASGVEGVPGSGIGEGEMRDRLVDELGSQELGERLLDGGGGGNDGGEDQPPQDSETADESPPEEDRQDSSDGGEPAAEDDDWSWD